MRFIGDVVLTTPVIKSVRAAYPDAYIAYLGEANAVALLEHNPSLNEIIPFNFAKPAVIEQSRVALQLRRGAFDLAVDMFGNPRSALLTWLSGAPVRVGPERKGRGRLYTIRVRDDGQPKTAIAFHNQSLAAAGIPPTASRTELFLTPEERREGRIYVQWLGQTTGPAGLSGPLICLHPGASWPAKRWFPERFAELADLLRAKLGAEVLVSGGPADNETTAAVLRHAHAPVRVLSALPLRQLAAVLSHCAVVVSNDAGPMHIAAALGVPTIGIFGPGEENIWFPYDDASGHRALRKDVPCHPCRMDFCPREGAGYMECMKLLTVAEVFDAVAHILRR
jgi:lipopolysaccharide heptosyltransferase II